MVRARNAQGWVKAPRVTVHAVYCTCREYAKRDGTYHPKDEDNARASLKAAIDALKDAGIVDNDSHAKVRWGEFTMITALRPMLKAGLKNGLTLTVVPEWPTNP